ncbi:MAG: hypothetical protein ACP5O6_04280, partial [Candidatus Baltobacteraceae bacterium]
MKRFAVLALALAFSFTACSRVQKSGTVGPNGTGLAGTIEGPACTDFSLTPSITLPVPPAPSACRMDQDGP